MPTPAPSEAVNVTTKTQTATAEVDSGNWHQHNFSNIFNELLVIIVGNSPDASILPVIIIPEGGNNEPAAPSKIEITLAVVIKSLIEFLATRQNAQLWNYEDITAKVWSIKSAEQIDVFLQYILKIFRESLPNAHINERWAQTALQLGLSCSSRHYAGRSLQIYRALRVPITSRMLSDILSRLVETVAEQGEDMQGKLFIILITLFNKLIIFYYCIPQVM